MAHQLKLYVDSDLKEPVRRFRFPRTEIGQSSDIPFYINNASEKWPIVEITYNQNDKEVTVLDIPQTLRAQQKVKCRARYTPAINTNEALSTIIDITGELHIG